MQIVVTVALAADGNTRHHRPSRSSSRDPADVSLLGELHGTYLSLEEKHKW